MPLLNDYILALAMLSMPGEVPYAVHYPRRCLLELAIADNLYDPREIRWKFVQGWGLDNHHENLKELRDRWSQRNILPPLHETLQLPCPATIRDLIALNRQHENWIEQQMKLVDDDDSFIFQVWWEENTLLYKILDMALDATDEGYYCYYRRNALKKLRDDYLGYENYHKGLLPPAVPIWRFKRIP